MKMKPILLTACCVLMLAGAGCSKGDAEAVARKERVASLLAEARKAEAQGDAATAESFYQQILVLDPADANVHLSYANLAQDARKNYLVAIYHYQRYLDLQPDSDKAAIAKDRLAAARTLLANELAAEILAREQRAMAAERDALQTQLADLEKAIRALKNTVSARDAENEELTARIKHLEKRVKQLSTDGEVAEKARESAVAEARKAREALDAELAKPDLSGTAEMVAAARELEREILEEVDGGAPKKDEALRAVAQGAKDEAPIAASPTRGKRYVVRPGDTYSALAREAYGTAAEWPRIRDANRSTTNPNGRLLAGESIYIP